MSISLAHPCAKFAGNDLRDDPVRRQARPLKAFDLFFTDIILVKNQILDVDQFLDEVDLEVIMVKNDHIKQN